MERTTRVSVRQDKPRSEARAARLTADRGRIEASQFLSAENGKAESFKLTTTAQGRLLMSPVSKRP
jgi:hypothetical protein